ncbi:putative fluoride ion transporter CrcB [Dictyobacter vulcani]|uniref:Fluoride-specific ion channel FluC n=1 Tax=Dictyobacter vulcani TaxID=2607529 RepID=A0A5J4KWX4_9CHLR|nr:fluoride efflux transporter CrcB [Dictyobacter vulcani]GER91983.1 putative fluoride ion transporter CrcB [Dictyobacter vulcani]
MHVLMLTMLEGCFLLQLVFIGLAGALGAVARYMLGHVITQSVGSNFPYGTLVINLSGSFLIGLVFALTAHHLLSPALQLILATGFLGGYTTFSTMSWEGVQLARGSIRLSVLYLGATYLFGLLAVAGGIALGWWL